MIPFAVKVVWFWLALTGLLQCWVTLVYFGRNFGGLWGRLYYSAFVTLLEGMFCLGMIWHMNPSRMPHAFCIAQVISFSLASFALTGLCASFALACARVVFRPRDVNTGRAVVAWHPRYIPLTIIFPVVASITHTTILVTFKAVRPSMSDDLHCDATDPLWVRLVGYSGVPLLVTLPFLVLSVATAHRLYKVKQSQYTRGTHTPDDGDAYGDDYGSPNIHMYGMQGPQRRSVLSLSAFLPYPAKALFKKSAPILSLPKSPFVYEPYDHSPHEHPLPVRDSVTGSGYSPPIKERDSPINGRALHTSNAHIQSYQRHVYEDQSCLSPHDHTMRSGSTTPDSAVSSTMPVFAANPLFPSKHVAKYNAVVNHGVSLSPLNEIGKAQTGLAVTVGDSLRTSVEVGERMDEDVSVGLAITTDEPERLTPTPRFPVPTPLKSKELRSPISPNAYNVGEKGSHHSNSRQSSLDTETALRGGARSRESASSPRQLLRSNYSSPEISSSSVAFVREDNGALPLLSPTSASYLQSRVTPESPGIEFAVNIGRTQQSESNDGFNDRDDEEFNSMEWEDDGSKLDTPTPTYRRRDPRQRLGVYNPTPPMGAAMIAPERRRRVMREGTHNKGGATLGSAIWRIIIFQIAFFSIQLLACLSAMIDVARHKITPFGTQHVALILAAWGPLWIFAPVPAWLSRLLMRWKI